jgi:hypothetical protein
MRREATGWPARAVRVAAAAWLLVVGVAVLARGVAASNAAVGLSDASGDALAVPRWLYVATGGGAIGASALLAGFVTDRRFVATIHGWRRDLGGDWFRRGSSAAAGVVGVVLLALVIYRGFVGPQIPTLNFAVIVVFAGGRAGLTIATYAVGNVWPALNPLRIFDRLPGVVAYPNRLGRWPALAGILLLVWVETTTAVTRQPDVLATALVGYVGVALVGSVVVGGNTWLRNVDPIATALRFYGRVAPLAWDRGRLTASIPGMRLVSAIDPDGAVAGEGSTERSRDTDERVISGLDDVAIAVALVWELTFSGFVTTEQGAATVRTVAAGGVSPLFVYAALFVGGFAVFYLAFLGAARVATRRMATTRSPRTLAVAFAPSLLIIAAGYHLAHYFGFFISLSPSLAAALSTPLSAPANPVVLTLPAWVSALNIGFVLGGHLVAIWVAHSTAYQLFPSRLQAIRSQYPFVLVMIGYTAVSLWLISLPTASPAFLG